MKKLIISMVAIMAVTTCFAQNFSTYNVPSVSYNVPTPSYNIPGTVNNNTTYVPSHSRTMPNHTNWDNFSTQGNRNSYTGTTGYRARDYSSNAYNYGVGHIIHTGPRGGQYYNNNNGHRTYVPKRSRW